MRFVTLLFAVLWTGCSVKFTGQFREASAPKHPSPSLPEKTFESFWQTFEDHYAFFALRKVDWHASYQHFRPRVTASTSNDSLFSILSTMVKPLQDDHVNIIYPKKKSYQEFTAEKPSRFLKEFPDDEVQQKFWSMVDHSLRQNGFNELKFAGLKEDDIPLFTYSNSKTTGYIRFTRCYVSAKTEDDPFQDGILAATIFDSVLERFKDLNNIIIDVRNNEGGNDTFSYVIANRFTEKKTIGHYKQFRTGGYEDFSPLETYYLEPQGVLFTKPVYILTNDQTASAADVFALIMRALPNTTLIGENSTGIYSDMYGFKLPNGWYASLSNERYYSSEMKCYEGIGTPVDHVVLNSRNDLSTMLDLVLEKALQH